MRAVRSLGMAALASAAVLLGCSGGAPDVTADDGPAAASASALSTTADVYVFVRQDLRKCVSPMCGGFYVRVANGCGREQYVSRLDLSAAHLNDAATEDVVTAPAEDLVLKGHLGPREARFNTRSFVVTEAYRGLPGGKAAGDEVLFQVKERKPPIMCLVAPCPNLIVTPVNGDESEAFDGLTVDRTAAPFVDKAWIGDRVAGHGALAIGSFVEGEQFPGGREALLDTGRVFLRLPDRAGPCPAPAPMQCKEGALRAYARDENRCMVFQQCVSPGICTMSIPVCAEGYTLVSWTGENGCPSYACDPSFLVE